jgi:hypothetical protein
MNFAIAKIFLRDLVERLANGGDVPACGVRRVELFIRLHCETDYSELFVD